MVIAISGYAGSGKDTLADELIKKNLSFPTTKYAFASALKETVSCLTGVPLNFFNDRDKKDSPLIDFPIKNLDSFSTHVNTFMDGEFKLLNKKPHHTPRSLAILLGSTMRSINPHYWVNRTMIDIGDGFGKLSIITDLRYRSELSELRNRYGNDLVSIRINRYDSKSKDGSERDLDNTPFDIVLENNGTMDELVNKCLNALISRGATLG